MTESIAKHQTAREILTTESAVRLQLAVDAIVNPHISPLARLRSQPSDPHMNRRLNSSSRSLLFIGTTSIAGVSACRDYTCVDYANCESPDVDAGPSEFTLGTTQFDSSSSRTSSQSTSLAASAPPVSRTADDASDASSSVADVDAALPAVTTNAEDATESSDEPTPLALGSECEVNSDCNSDSCANGVCCESTCDGLCQTCNSAGACVEVPTDDDDCETLTCEGTNACVNYPAPKNTDRCVALGECLTAEAYCTPTFEVPGTPCGSGLECDGAGSCESVCPTGQVWCDGICLGSLSCKVWQPTASLVDAARRIDRAWTAITSAGNAMVVWVERTADNQVSKDLWARSFDATTESWSTPSLVNTTSTYIANVTVAPDGPDAFLVVWDESIDATIKSRRWANSSWGEPLVVATKTGNAVRMYPNDGESGMMTYWSEYDDSTENYSIRSRMWNTEGGAWSSAQTLQASSRYFGEMTTAIASSGAAFVVWERLPETPGDWELWGARFSPTGNTWSAPTMFGSALDRQSGFGLAVTTAGDLVGYLAGRLKGVVWDAASSGWVSVTSAGEWTDLRLCALGENIMVATKSDAQRWNRESGWLEPTLALPPDTASFTVSCNDGGVLVVSSDSSENRVDRWDEATQTWLAPFTTSQGRVLASALGLGGSAVVVRGADYDPNSFPGHFGIEVDFQR